LSWKIYIIQTKSGKLYTGITTNLNRRFNEHKTKKRGASFFNFSEPELILYEEDHISRSEASKRECKIKKMSRKQKLELILQKSEKIKNLSALS
jgi:putative endonuclease